LAKPGLSGRSSNSSEQTTQVLIGKPITINDNAGECVVNLRKRALSHWLKPQASLVLALGILDQEVD
jgi:hypothetical protein